MKGVVAGLILVALSVALTKLLWPSTVVVPGPPAAPTVLDVSDETRGAYDAVLRRLGSELVAARERNRDLGNLRDTVYVDSIVRIPIPCPAEGPTGDGTASTPVLPGSWYPLQLTVADEYGAETLLRSKWIEVHPGEVRTRESTSEFFTTGPLRGLEAGPDRVHLYFDESFPSASCPLLTKVAWGLGGAGAATIVGGVVRIFTGP